MNVILRRPAHPVNDAAGTSEPTVELGLFTGAHSSAAPLRPYW